MICSFKLGILSVLVGIRYFSRARDGIQTVLLKVQIPHFEVESRVFNKKKDFQNSYFL